MPTICADLISAEIQFHISQQKISKKTSEIFADFFADGAVTRVLLLLLRQKEDIK
jgi:hypothetical protein